jgi:hypothetical protein
MTKDKLKEWNAFNVTFAQKMLKDTGKCLPMVTVMNEAGELHVYGLAVEGVPMRDIVRKVLLSYKPQAVAFSTIAEAWTLTMQGKGQQMTKEDYLRERAKLPDSLEFAQGREECLLICTSSRDYTIIQTQIFKRSSGGFAFEDVSTMASDDRQAPEGAFIDMRKLLAAGN